MLALKELIKADALAVLDSLYGYQPEKLELQLTRKEFEGELTLVVFPIVRFSKKSPEVTAAEIGEALVKRMAKLESFNVVKGFLNLKVNDAYFIKSFAAAYRDLNYGKSKEKLKPIMVEYSSPNTNKPLHLGHIRNNLLGYSVAEILKAAGHPSVKVQIINDRGIHICKSMIAWMLYGKGEEPITKGIKGDKLVGKYYVLFDKEYKMQQSELIASGFSEEEAKERAPIMIQARDLLMRWEQGDPETIALWKKMNQWVYDGFDATYEALGVDFDKNYYESETYLLGKKVVDQGLETGIFYKEDDGSVWIDLEKEGLDKKLLLRGDGTSVYMTQDLGTAIQRFQDFKSEGLSSMIYTVGNEQDYHFKVLFTILKKMGYDWADELYHLSYGMVDLPSGKMKSREGTVVDADDLINDMISEAKRISEELGKTEGLEPSDKDKLYSTIGLGALKYFILKVDPKKRMMFDPEESIDFTGNTGPFIQYTYARINSLLKKGGLDESLEVTYSKTLDPAEKAIIKQLMLFPMIITQAAEEHSPAVIANYIYDLVKVFNTMYQQLPILNDEDSEAIVFRIQLSSLVARSIKLGMSLLGIEVPNRM